jgi:hypothetical protein
MKKQIALLEKCVRILDLVDMVKSREVAYAATIGVDAAQQLIKKSRCLDVIDVELDNAIRLLSNVLEREHEDMMRKK